jgi:hypothetical protein
MPVAQLASGQDDEHQSKHPKAQQNAVAHGRRGGEAAYGWPEDPDELSEEELLRRLLDLNLQRCNEE